MTDIIGRKVFGWIEVDANQIVNGVVVFDLIEPADRSVSRIGLGVAIGFFEDGIDRFQECFGFGQTSGRGRSVGGISPACTWRITFCQILRSFSNDDSSRYL